jgi:hypothetical protein
MVASSFLYLAGALIGGVSVKPWLREAYSPIPGWEAPSLTGDASIPFPTSLTHNVKPLRCHSHNDYWRQIPLYQALHYGCTSVEADVWLMDVDERGDFDFYVGHTPTALKRERTLRNLYNNTVARSNGVFESSPAQSLVLLVDLKNDPYVAFDAFSAQLEPLRTRGYLTYHNGTDLVPGPLTIVATGRTPYSSILSQPSARRDIFFDAPLGDLTRLPKTKGLPVESAATIHQFPGYNTTTSLYASESLRRVLGHPVPFLLPGSPSIRQLERIRSVTRAAHARGLKVRWWDTPDWPRSRRERVWEILIEEGADVLNVDDLKEARDWDGWQV